MPPVLFFFLLRPSEVGALTYFFGFALGAKQTRDWNSYFVNIYKQQQNALKNLDLVPNNH